MNKFYVSFCSSIRNSILQHDAMYNAPGNIECCQDNDKLVEERGVSLEWEKADCDKHKNKCPNEERDRLYTTTSQDGLPEETAQIMRIELNGF